ncbi:MAG: Cys-tRNA(Pro) deacylase [bacterium]|nr:Cys-tRNA(Pro) deacylase [bacterium]
MSATAATKFLDRVGASYATHEYDYVERGGAEHAAECLDVPGHVVVKTLVMRTDAGRRLLVLMHGDRQVAPKRLAHEAGARKVSSCTPDEAFRATGYVVGGISPFGVRTELPVFAEATIFDLPNVYINGGRRGLLLEIAPGVIRETLGARPVRVAAA